VSPETVIFQLDDGGETPEQVRAYFTALRTPIATVVDGVRKTCYPTPEAAHVIADDPRYRFFLTFVSPPEWIAAANRPDWSIEQLADRLVASGSPRAQVMAAVWALDTQRDEEDEEPEWAAPVQRPYNSEYADAPRADLAEVRRVYGRGDPNRPSQRPAAPGQPAARTIRKQKQVAREREGAAIDARLPGRPGRAAPEPVAVDVDATLGSPGRYGRPARASQQPAGRHSRYVRGQAAKWGVTTEVADRRITGHPPTCEWRQAL
jgi:hypothetical protein